MVVFLNILFYFSVVAAVFKFKQDPDSNPNQIMILVFCKQAEYHDWQFCGLKLLHKSLFCYFGMHYGLKT